MYVQLLFVLIFGVAVGSKVGLPCVTPNGENATCVPFLRCPVIAAAVATFSPEALKFGQDSKCGSRPGMVCCGSTGVPKPTTSSVTIAEDGKVVLNPSSDKTLCGLDALPSYRIKGGTIAEFKEFPWLAAIEYNSTYTKENAGIRCGGSLINEDYVLTAAHCIVHIEFYVIKAWLGVTNIGSNGNCLKLAGKLECVNSTEKVVVIKALPHPRYNSAYGNNDIGLLRLGHRIKFTDYVRPLCLPAVYSPLPKIETYFMVAGWGITENNTHSDIKLKVEVPMQNKTLCNKYLKYDNTALTPEQLCVGGKKGKDTCQGDSGGPLMRNFINENGLTQWYQEGIVSYGVGCGVEGRPAIYTRCSPYVEWVFEKIRNSTHLRNGNTCETPYGTIAKCIPLNECQAVSDLALSKRSSDRKLALKYFCGYNDKQPFVCCEAPSPVVIPSLDTKGFPDKTVCGLVKKAPRTNGSAIAEVGEFPWVVGIQFEEDDEDIGIQCSGALISNRHVLTKAECLTDEDREAVTVLLGDWNITSELKCNKTNSECADPVKKVPIKKIITHPFHNFYYDVALVLLEDEIQFTDYVSPICLPFSNIPLVESGTQLTLAAWDSTEDGISQDVLRRFPFVLKEECNEPVIEIYGSPSYVDELCWEFKWKNFSDSISQTPVMRSYADLPNETAHWYLDGLASVRYYSDTELAIDYTSIYNHLHWITNMISEE